MAKKEVKETPMMVVQSKMKDHLVTLGMRSSGDVADGLNAIVSDALAKAAARCKANGRTTVRASDL